MPQLNPSFPHASCFRVLREARRGTQDSLRRLFQYRIPNPKGPKALGGPQGVSADAARSKLDKIAEEPEAPPGTLDLRLSSV